MSFEDEYAGKSKKRDPIRAFLPVLGLFLAVALGAIAWAIHEPLRDIIVEQIADLPQEGEEGFVEVGYAVAGIVFIALLMVASLIYAAFAPKPTKQVTERELKREKELTRQEQLARKKRQAEIRKRQAEARKQQENK